MAAVHATPSREDLATALLGRVGEDLGQICDQDVVLALRLVEEQAERAAGADKVHISFRLRFRDQRIPGAPTDRWGTLLLPLAEAVSLACSLLMVPDEAVATHRRSVNLDETTKDAVMEVGNFVGGGVDACLRSLFDGDVTARFGGCQGVRAGVRPAMPYEEGEPLLVARGEGRIGDFPAFPFLMLLPPLV